MIGRCFLGVHAIAGVHDVPPVYWHRYYFVGAVGLSR
jgi:hypothetical protein